MAYLIRTSELTLGARASALRFLGVVVLLVVSGFDARALAADNDSRDPAQECASFGNQFDASTDVNAFKEYSAAIAQSLLQEDFKRLDCIADSARSNKTKFAGGTPQLHIFYRGVSDIEGHTTEEDWTDRLQPLQRWVASRPQSITARVALAKAYVNYAWDARGKGFGETVSDSGWRLFAERLEKAKTILDQASALEAKCPEWYLAMQQVAQGQGWDLDQATRLFEQARAFAPDYYYNYRVLAAYLLPKWSGQEDDTAKFAEENANRVGGAEGDILYFQIAAEIACACNDPEFSRISWPRLQKGYAELEKKYGPSMVNLNSLALMAVNNGDAVAADAAFKRIGQEWDKGTWMTEDYFNQSKTSMAQMAPGQAQSRVSVQEAEANLQTSEGPRYQKAIEQTFAAFMRQCAKAGVEDTEKSGLMLKVGIDGAAEDAWMTRPSAMAGCLMKRLYESHLKKEIPFPPPPHPGYWLKLELDPDAEKAVSN